ncbi:MAG: DUF2716 domain-containing protein [Ruminococcus sp.]|nr:DUF2716 domain-containing protein [Ruminococcus sp.]MCM1381031.1 DUF2716 domain-containing protein [Muribaculaceae bacterium]MCM1479205.1 DUF2716 domain-containing protein [Muribaculaceae bacterium]
MEIILDKEKYDKIWEKIDCEFMFTGRGDNWISLPFETKKYRLNSIFSDEQEKIVNSVFCGVNPKDMYALDWQHDCFIYNPCEEIPPYYWFYDEKRDCNVYFPSYYPNGDYYFFVSLDWRLGLYGHPWRKEIIVAGNELIREFEKVKDELDITEILESPKKRKRKWNLWNSTTK